MTQQVYRLELTDDEKAELINVLEISAEAARLHADLRRSHVYVDEATRYELMANRLRALEPVGTEGGS